MVTLETRKCRFIVTPDNEKLFITVFDDNNNPIHQIPEIMQKDLEDGVVTILDEDHQVFITDGDITTATLIKEYPYLRKKEYDQLEKQLDLLWHDIDNGLLGENAKTGTWYSHIKLIKEKYPKS